MTSFMIIMAASTSAAAGLDPAWIALFGAIFGGAGLKITEAWLGRNKVRVDDATQIRDELRLEITSQREEIKGLETEAHRWREEYYALRDKYMTLQLELLKKVDNIKHEVESAEKTAEEIDKIPPVVKEPPLTENPKE